MINVYIYIYINRNNIKNKHTYSLCLSLGVKATCCTKPTFDHRLALGSLKLLMLLHPTENPNRKFLFQTMTMICKVHASFQEWIFRWKLVPSTLCA